MRPTAPAFPVDEPATHEVQRASHLRIGEHAPRTAQAVSGTGATLNADRPTTRIDDPPSRPRTAHEQGSVQVRDPRPPSQRPMAVARRDVADLLDAEMHAAWVQGNDALSNCAVARACSIDEHTVRNWRKAAKPVPLAALRLLPFTLAASLVAALLNGRGQVTSHRRAVQALGDALDALERPVPTAERAEVLRAAAEAMARLGNVMAKAAGGDGR